MFLFFANEINGTTATFGEAESRHCIHVLRKGAGDEVHFTDGKGGWYVGVILRANKKGFSAKIISQKLEYGRPAFHLHVGIAPTKNIDRFEWFLEKATEFGISEITPLHCSNSERKRIRPERLEKVLLAAMKQSLKAYLPKLNELCSFEGFMEKTATDSPANRFIAHCRNGQLPHLKDNYLAGNDVVVLVGPEGDFSKEEISLAAQKGYSPVSLGNARLRTETAGIAAVHIINLANH
ncbi:MAG TPA: 16S rRNA (uracil(1498)-N(3))-methyltransferase [Bacteroidetes bacterium]|nr:16S rRNA (uracil(1498)-N(3))-methyltransferase [Bacteroidota bacterium]